jgi:hypothetical protein
LPVREADIETDESWKLVAWAPPAAATKADLIAKVRELQLLALAERDAIIGLRAEIATARAKIEEIEKTPVGKAFRRIDKLEEQREQLLHRLRLGRFGEESDDEVAVLKASTTWRIGRLFVGPVYFVRDRLRRK